MSRQSPATRHRARGVSTVLDVVVCLLLVSAAVLTVHGIQPRQTNPAADAAGETAALLGTTTTNVSYSLGPGVRATDTELSFPRNNSSVFDRSAHGTYAELLAAAALANLSVAGAPVTHVNDGFETAVREEVRTVLVGRGWRGQVVATWTPFAGSSLSGTFTVGDAPPPNADVHTARITVPVRFEWRSSPAKITPGSFEILGRQISTRVVSGLFPPDETAAQLRGAYPEFRLAVLKYRTLGAAYGLDSSDWSRSLDVSDVNDRLADAMAPTVAADLEHSFESPAAAADGIRLQYVSIVVRTWSP